MSRMKVELLHIHKRFGAVQANRDVSLRVEAGTIHGLLGENGAGKSTLVKILSGFLRCDQGEIWIDGQPVRIDSPAAAIRLGISMLHQDPLDFPSLTVLENFIAGQRGRLGLGLRESRKRLEKACEEFGFNLNPDGAIGSLTVGERQQLEMLRLLSLGINTLILDEPTTGISAAQKDLLFAALRRLAGQGKSVIFVSHKLADVECLCDRVTVMRQGEVVGELPVRGEDIPLLEQQLIDWMFGRELTPPARPHSPQRRADPLLELRSLVVRHEPFALALPDLAVQPGEVIGLAGLEGSGQRSFLLTCAGLLPPRRGRILLGGQEMTGRPYGDYLRCGVGFSPADRLREGLIPGLTLQEHFALQQQDPWINWALARQQAQAAIEHFSIRGHPYSRVEQLSGGNQQRSQLALLPTPLSLLLMEHPTRGLDIESALWVWGQLLERTQAGTAILFASADLDEILQYSDRVMVFSGGQVSEPIPAAELTVSRLGQMMTLPVLRSTHSSEIPGIPTEV
ncbi:MAG: ATP-binding cassette domain-containing protein [Cyanobacteriota bacterium PSP.bin.10]|nr:ATP-binding cassette domain-containing protein [Cyanobacteriota bacterium PSP.bin.10]